MSAVKPRAQGAKFVTVEVLDTLDRNSTIGAWRTVGLPVARIKQVEPVEQMPKPDHIPAGDWPYEKAQSKVRLTDDSYSYCSATVEELVDRINAL